MSEKDFYDHIFDSEEEERKKISDPKLKQKLNLFDDIFKEVMKKSQEEVEQEDLLSSISPSSPECDIDLVEQISDNFIQNKELSEELKKYYKNHIQDGNCIFCQEALNEFKKNDKIEVASDISITQLMNRINNILKPKENPVKKPITDIIIEYKNKLFNVIDRITNIQLIDTLAPAELTARSKEETRAIIAFSKKLKQNVIIEIRIHSEKDSLFNLLVSLSAKKEEPVKNEKVIMKNFTDTKQAITDLSGAVEFSNIKSGTYTIISEFGETTLSIES